MNNKNIHIAATVILYNPEENIISNIGSYANFVDLIILIDNSEEHNIKLIKNLKEKFKNSIYINNNQNLGIATALNIGCETAIKKGFDWILTMDQDSKFLNFIEYKNCLLNLKKTSDIAILAANMTYNAKEKMRNNLKYNYEEKDFVITSGNLLNLKLFHKIGRFEDKLFIDMVDYDYSARVREHNFKILYFENILAEHALGTLFKRKNLITRKVKEKIEHNPQRVYYISRNSLYLWKRFSKSFPKEFNLLKILNILFIHEITKIILYEDKKLKKIYYKFLGLFHFCIDKYGKYKIES